MSAAGRRRPELSQHFLRRSGLASQLVRQIALAADDLVVEVGPGRGMLTAALLDTGARVLAVEADPALAALVRERFGRAVEVVEGDFRRFVIPEGARVVANLPFAITSDAVRQITTSGARDAHLIVQREAAERFAGAPHAPETLMSLLLKPWWHVEVLRPLRRVDFDPPPSVDCAFLWLARRDPPLVRDAESYHAFVRRSFGRARTMREALRASFTRPQAERLARDLRLPLDAPPSAATFEQWLALFRASTHLAEAALRDRQPDGQARR